MNDAVCDSLERHFDTAFAAPDGIKKLRELILTLAMQGKLVEQDPNDPPASQLLKEIEAEKKRLVKEGKIKAPKPLPEIKPEEVPYALPQGWEWVRLGNVVDVLDSQRKPVTKEDRELGPYPYYGASGIVDYVSNYIFDEPLVLVGEDGAKWGKGESTAFSITGKTWVNNHAHVIRPLRSVLIDKYIVYSLVGMDLQPFITGMTVPKLNQARLNSIEIPLPPLIEQHRIVTKIDQLMVRCDELEKLRDEREQKRRSIHTAALKQLLDAQAGNNFADVWRFITLHFGELYAVRENVTELRKAILQLAVMGKLVPQNPNDPPASQLLKEIEAEKRRLVKEGKIKAPKPLPEIKPGEVPYVLPQGWGWVRFGDLVQVLNGRAYKQNELLAAGTPVLRVGNLFTSNHWYYSDLALEDEKYIDSGDLIYAWSASFGPFIWSGDKVIYHYHIWKLAFFMQGSPQKQYLYNYLLDATDRIKRSGSGIAMLHMTKERMEKLLVPLPPLPEQHRIVAKIDSLMLLCDALEQQIDAAAKKQTALLDAVMAQV